MDKEEVLSHRCQKKFLEKKNNFYISRWYALLKRTYLLFEYSKINNLPTLNQHHDKTSILLPFVSFLDIFV